MENVTSATSEEELLQLRNEGKISEAEYQDLLGTLKKPIKVGTEPTAQDVTKPTKTSTLAIASLAFALALGPFGSIPAIICGHLALRRIERALTLKGRGLALAGLIVGYTVLGISMALSITILLPILAYHKAAISPPTAVEVIEFKRFPIDSMEGLLTKTGVRFEKELSSDGNGSFRIQVAQPTTIRLFETGDIDLENARLIYRAMVRADHVNGRVYLEMRCHFPGKGEFFSKGLATALTGTTSWTTQETPFFLKKGENPDNVKLNLVIDGSGDVFIDDIRLLKGPLE